MMSCFKLLRTKNSAAVMVISTGTITKATIVRTFLSPPAFAVFMSYYTLADIAPIAGHAISLRLHSQSQANLPLGSEVSVAKGTLMGTEPSPEKRLSECGVLVEPRI